MRSRIRTTLINEKGDETMKHLDGITDYAAQRELTIPPGKGVPKKLPVLALNEVSIISKLKFNKWQEGMPNW